MLQWPLAVVLINLIKIKFKAAVCNFYLFVALCLKTWNCSFLWNYMLCFVIRCFSMVPARMNLMFWGECVVVSHCTGVDIYCLCLGIYDPNQNLHRILPSEQVSNKSATFVLINWGKKHYNKSHYQRWLNLKIS